ncbi:hypothetical protein M8C21_023261, partial [Ambrosia artemisiifolia]
VCVTQTNDSNETLKSSSPVILHLFNCAVSNSVSFKSLLGPMNSEVLLVMKMMICDESGFARSLFCRLSSLAHFNHLLDDTRKYYFGSG